MNGLLLAAILVRFVVLITCDDESPDPHLEVIRYIGDHWKLPISNELNQSYHPPLYYVLMASLSAASHSVPLIHFVSFLFSTANLLLIRRILKNPLVLPNPMGKAIAFGIACLLPEFVMFSGYISNDTMTFFVGSVFFLVVLRYIEQPTGRRLAVMGVMVGVGLLTKGTFIGTGAALMLLVALVEARRGRRHAAVAVCGFTLLWASLGSYKYIENTIKLGRPIVHNLDLHGIAWQTQRPTWNGWQTLYDINIMEIVREPTMRPRNTVSYPLLMYATFWYPHIPHSWMFLANLSDYRFLGSVIYLFGLVPTLIYLAGFGKGVAASVRLSRVSAHQRLDHKRWLLAMCSLLLIIPNVAVVLAAA